MLIDAAALIYVYLIKSSPVCALELSGQLQNLCSWGQSEKVPRRANCGSTVSTIHAVCPKGSYSQESALRCRLSSNRRTFCSTAAFLASAELSLVHFLGAVRSGSLGPIFAVFLPLKAPETGPGMRDLLLYQELHRQAQIPGPLLRVTPIPG